MIIRTNYNIEQQVWVLKNEVIGNRQTGKKIPVGGVIVGVHADSKGYMYVIKCGHGGWNYKESDVYLTYEDALKGAER